MKKQKGSRKKWIPNQIFIELEFIVKCLAKKYNAHRDVIRMLFFGWCPPAPNLYVPIVNIQQMKWYEGANGVLQTVRCSTVNTRIVRWVSDNATTLNVNYLLDDSNIDENTRELVNRHTIFPNVCCFCEYWTGSLEDQGFVHVKPTFGQEIYNVCQRCADWCLTEYDCEYTIVD